MKSKISFFNKTIFLKNLTLYWPIWAVYTCILVVLQPFILWASYYMARHAFGYTKYQYFSDLLSVLSMNKTFLIASAAVVVGIALYHYLYNSKSANMIHSLPVDRTQLFGTNLISGLTFLWGPHLVSSVLMTVIALIYGAGGLGNIWLVCLLDLATAFIAFSFVTFCAMFTGHMAAMPVYVVILNALPFGVYYLLSTVVSLFGYGITGLGEGAYAVARFFSPLFCFMENVFIREEYNEFSKPVGLKFYGVEIVLVYAVVAILLYLCAYLVYKKRKIEQTGDFITVEWVKPIFRFGVGTACGFIGAVVLREVLISIGIGCSDVAYVVMLLTFGAVGYFAADMLVKKTFHVFKKKNWIGCGIFSGVLLAGVFALYIASSVMENYIPEEEEIKTASIRSSYTIEFEGAEVAVVRDIHKAILAEKDFCERMQKSPNYDYEYVTVQYQLKNGKYVDRSYRLYVSGEQVKEVIAKIAALEVDPDNYLTHTFCEDYAQIDQFFNGYLEAQFAKSEIDWSYENRSLTAEQTKDFFEAVLADAKAGTLLKYNVYSYSYIAERAIDMHAYKGEANLYIEYLEPNVSQSIEIPMENGKPVDSRVNIRGAHIAFGADCENIINTMIEHGIIKSVEDIWWNEY